MNAEGMGIITGAGISVAKPASLPAGNALRNAILGVCHQAALKCLAPALDDKLLLDRLHNESWKLEFVVGRLHKTVGRVALSVLDTLAVAVPNENHMLLAMHLAEGGIQATFNFDEGIETAYKLIANDLIGLPPGTPGEFVSALTEWRRRCPRPAPTLNVVTTTEQFREWRQNPLRPTLLKLHGSLSRSAGQQEPVIIDSTEMLHLPPERLFPLDVLAGEEQLLITGYSGNDLDFYDPILERLEPGRFRWVAPSHDSVVKKTLSDIDPSQPEDGFAAPLLRSTVPGCPLWPAREIDAGRFDRAFKTWAAKILSEFESGAAEAFAWMLLDARDYDLAIQLLESLFRERPTPNVSIRLASALNHRNRTGDKLTAARYYRRVFFMQHSDMGQRVQALVRYGACYRGVAIHGDRIRFKYLAKSFAGVTAALLLSLLSRKEHQQRAEALGVMAHTLQRVIEILIPRSFTSSVNRLLLSGLARLTLMTHKKALQSDDGYHSTFVTLQLDEMRAIYALLRGHKPPDEAATRIDEVERAYKRIPDARGIANALGAKALIALSLGATVWAHAICLMKR